MTLGDLRKFSIRQQTRIRFALANGMECVVNEHGVAQVPALNTVPDFNLEQELVAVRTFQLDSVPTDPKIPVKSRTLRRDELAALTDGTPVTAAHDDHDDE
jgi:hypothetical protein